MQRRQEYEQKIRVVQYQLLIKICKNIIQYIVQLYSAKNSSALMDNIPNLKYKTTLCLNWGQGLFCEKADGCYFAHGQEDLRTIEQNRIAIAQRNRVHLDSRPLDNYKTIFCKFYGKGECKLGDACTYAHERREKKMKKANTISYELENQYALYAYYSQLNPWMLQYAPFATPAPLPQESFMHDENINEQMKMSSETASSEREASPLQKTEKSSEEFGKFVLMESQEEEQKYSVELNTVS